MNAQPDTAQHKLTWWNNLPLIGDATRRTKLFWYFEILVVAACALNLALDIGKYFPGFTEFYVAADNTYHANGMPMNWPITQNPISEIRTVNRQSYTEAEAVIQAAAASGATTVTLQYVRDGVEETVEQKIEPFTLGHWLDILLLPLIISACCLFLSYKILTSQPNNAIYRQAAIVFAMLDFVAIERSGLFWLENPVSKALDLVTITQACFFGSVVLHFGLSFPIQVKPKLATRVIRTAYTISTLTAIIYAISRLEYWFTNAVPTFHMLETLAVWGYRLIAGLGIVGTTAVWLYLLMRYWVDPIARRKLIILVAGILPTLLLLGVIVTGKNFVLYGIDTRISLLWFSMLVTFAIMRYQAFEVQSQFILIVPMVAVSAVLGNIAITILPYKNIIPSPFGILFFLFFVCSLIWGYSVSWRTWIERTLYPQRYQYELLRECNESFSQLNIRRPLVPVLNDVAAIVQDKLKLESVTFWVYDGAVNADGYLILRPIEQQHQLLFISKSELPPTTEVVRCNNTYTSTWQYYLSSVGFVLAIPLIVNEQILGVLACSQRRQAEFFSQKDIDIFKLIGQELALFVLMQRYVDQIVQLPNKLEAVQLAERTRLHNDLHDRVLSFFPALETALHLLQTTPSDSQDDLQSNIQNILTHTHTASTRLRQVIHNLQPDLDFNFTDTLSAAIREKADRHRLTLQLLIPAHSLDELSLDIKRALYYAALQAADNTCQHAAATLQIVTVEPNDTSCSITLQDNGRGFIFQREQTSQHFGLQIMRSRIEQVSGKLRIYSKPGNGTTVHIQVPWQSPTKNNHQI